MTAFRLTTFAGEDSALVTAVSGPSRTLETQTKVRVPKGHPLIKCCCAVAHRFGIRSNEA